MLLTSGLVMFSTVALGIGKPIITGRQEGFLHPPYNCTRKYTVNVLYSVVDRVSDSVL